ncbi:MAG TPA: hypothetical protein VM186_00775 [Planctomycetota bacterium]|nr:hypothetical protein [Planctomycetota bacterium]
MANVIPDSRLIPRVVTLCPVPTSTLSNASYGSFVFDGGTGNDKLTSYQMTVGGVTYTRSITYDGSDKISAISAWSVV